MTGPTDKDSDPYKREDYRHIQKKPKIDKMDKLKREVEFSERGMQIVWTKLHKVQQDPTLTPSMSMVGLKPKQFVDHHDYHIMKQGKFQDTHDNDRYNGLHSSIEQQVRADAMLSRQIYKEELTQFEKQIKQVENKRSNEDNFKSMGRQTIPNPTNFVRKDRGLINIFWISLQNQNANI